MARSNTTTEKPAQETPAPEQQAEPVTITGRLCFDPVLRHTQSGRAVCNLRIAVNQPDGEAEFHSAVCWGRTAETVAQYKRKGHAVEVTGSPRTRSWNDKDGNQRDSVEINAYRIQFVRLGQAEAKAPDAEAEPELAA